MAWTAPATAVSNSLFSAAWLNTYLRDNLSETTVAKATEPSQLFTTTASNAVSASTNASDYVAASETRTSATYGNLTTVGPSITITMKTFVIIRLSCQLSTAAASGQALMSFDISGATTLASSDTRAVAMQGVDTKKFTYYLALTNTSVNAGSNTFTAKYRGDGTNLATFVDREISAIAL